LFSLPKSALTALAVAISTAILAQSSGGDFEILKSTIDSGGDASAGGEFTLTATIGQSDASPQNAAGGEFTLSGGFWATVSDLIFKDGFEDF